MIKINLVPYKEEMKKVQAIRQMVIIAASVILLVLVLVSVHVFMTLSVGSLEAKVKSASNELERLKAITGNLDKFKEDKALVEKKLSIIKNLEGNRKISVHLLQALSEQVPEGQIWLTLFLKNDMSITIEGMAKDNDAIALFMSRLEASPYFESVDLVTSQQEVYADKVELKKFRLTCMVGAR